jgi:uncharacterized delta-60 repeat protein
LDSLIKPLTARLGAFLYACAAAFVWSGTARGEVLRLDAQFQPAFTTTRDAALFAVALQEDGRVLVAGNFSLVNGVCRRCVARLDAQGRLDPNFDAGSGVDGLIYALAVQPADGRILVAGRFTAAQGQPRTALARLESNGALDPAFAPCIEGRPGLLLGAVVVQPDGRIVIAGQFEKVDGRPRNGVARLLPGGALDEAFDPGRGLNDGAAYDLALQDDGRLLVAGAFAVVDHLTSPGVARLNPDGSVDTRFTGGIFAAGSWGRVYAVSVQPDLGVVVAGAFDSVDWATRQHVARLRFDGSLDETFAPPEGVEGGKEAVFDIEALPGGEVVITGSFTQAAGAERSGLARLTMTGAPDDAFDPGEGLEPAGVASGHMLVCQPDGKIIVVGDFREAGGAPRHCLARFLPDGSLDESFSNTNSFFELVGEVKTLAALPDGGLVVGGEFECVNGAWREGLARLGADGQLDPAFDARLNRGAVVNAVARDSEGRLVIGGLFDRVDGVEHGNLARLQPDGRVDASFDAPRFGGVVHALALPAAGGILAGGEFGVVDNIRRLRLVRLHDSGKVDENFDARFERELGDFAVRALALDAADGILVGGRFYLVNGQPKRHLARLFPDGSLDAGYAATLQLGGNENAAVTSLALQPDGRLVVGGTFASVNGVLQRGLARLRSDGSRDAGFQSTPGVAGGAAPAVQAVAALDGWRVVAGGEFARYCGQPAGNWIVTDSRGMSLDGGAGGFAADQPVTVLARTAADQLVVGGRFCLLDGEVRLGLARFAVSPPAPEFYVFISLEDGQVIVDWLGGGRLLEAENPAGPWREVPGAASPYWAPGDGEARVYRVVR